MFRGSAEGGFLFEYRGSGLYQDPQAGTLKSIYGGGTSTWSGGTNNTNTFLLSSPNQLTVTPSGGSAYVGVVKSIEFDLGVEITEVTDVNSGATGGLFSISVTDRNPRLTVVWGTDTDNSAAVTYKKFFDDGAGGVTHHVTWKYTDLGSRTLLFDFPYAQITALRDGEAQKVRTLSASYKLTGVAGDDEFLVTHA